MANDLKTKIAIVVKGEHYALDALKVRNILELSKITSVPNTKEFMLGIINLHGNIIPVADFGSILGKGNIEASKESAILVISPDESLESQIGFLVDEVNEVFEVIEEQIKPSIIIDGEGLVRGFEGTIMREGSFVQLIDIDNLISELEK